MLDRIKALHRVVTKNYTSVDSLLENYLAFGNEVFGCSIGIASKVTGDQYLVSSITKNEWGLEAGAIFPLGETYCSEVFRQKKTVSVHQAGRVEPFKSHPVYEQAKLETYISSPFYVQGQIYGTLNFTSTVPRLSAFEDQDHELIELMAESVGSFIEKKLSQEKSIEQEAMLIASSQLASLGEMAGRVAHEINNPLCVIGANSQLALKHLATMAIEENSPLQKHFTRILSSVDRIADIVAGMQKLLPAGQNEPFQKHKLEDIVKSALSLSHGRLQVRKIDLKVDLNLPKPVFCFAGQITQVLLNIINNSVEALDESKERWIQVSGFQNKSGSFLRVTDSGPGIPKDSSLKVFQPFFTTKADRKASGLGLSISKRVAKLHEGDLVVESHSERTSLVLSIPHRNE